MPYDLTLSCYNGMHIDFKKDADRDEARRTAARVIRHHRNKLDYPVTILERGRRWELQSDPEGIYMVGDHEGVLALVERVHPICDGCGGPITGRAWFPVEDPDFGRFCSESCLAEAWQAWERELFLEEASARLNRTLTRSQLLRAAYVSGWHRGAAPEELSDAELSRTLAAACGDADDLEELIGNAHDMACKGR